MASLSYNSIQLTTNICMHAIHMAYSVKRNARFFKTSYLPVADDASKFLWSDAT